MKYFVKPIFALLLSSTLLACSSDDEATTTNQDNEDLFAYLQTDYFWNDALPESIDPTRWETMPDAMTALRAPEDRFSYVITNEEYDDYVASVFFGYGFSHQYTEDKDGLLIRYVFDQGSAYQQGLRRGSIITHVDGTSIADAYKNQTNLSDLFGPNEDGYTVDVVFTNIDNMGNTVTTETQFSKGEIIANTVMAAEVKNITINNSETKVGYLVFDSFKESSERELNDAFDAFADENIQELILDLRYNSGGRISIAKQLSQQIAGGNVSGELFVQYVHNELQSSSNRESYFNLGSGYTQLNLDRVIVLTSEYTCSASELVINSLMPFVDVTVIGNETCGKPIGMYPEDINDWTVFAINFQTQNAVGFGDYFDGLPVDCALDETIPGDWGDESEALLAEGIYYLQNEACSQAGMAGAKQIKPRVKINFSQGPIKIRNAL